MLSGHIHFKALGAAVLRLDFGNGYLNLAIGNASKTLANLIEIYLCSESIWI